MSSKVDLGEVLKKKFDLIVDLNSELPDDVQINYTKPVKPDCWIEAIFKKV